MMGTGGDGAICPIAVTPFGMVQLGPDTRLRGSGYRYSDKKILGFSHVHKSGGGCGDFLDIMFTPIVDPAWSSKKAFPEHVASNFSHDNEYSEPGYYKVQLLDFGVEVELTATERCGMHRYTYPQGVPNQVVVDLEHGNVGACSIFSEENFDTVKISHIEIIEPNIIKGYRISNGWAPTQHVYFYAEFSKKIVSYKGGMIKT